MNPTRRAFTVVLALGLIILIGLLSLPVAVHADDDYTYDESTPDGSTSDDDQIYFGYCATCYQGGPGLRICRKTGDDVTETAVAQGTGTLIIRGGGGNDHIEAISNDDKLDYHFDDFDSLNYTVIRLYGGEGDDLIIGPPKAELDRYQGLRIELHGEDGNDGLMGKGGGDFLYGGPANDYLQGDRGDDDLVGEGGDDFLVGDQDDDRLFGGEGRDILVGATGQDVIDGGAESDAFVCRTASSPHPIHDPADYDTDCDDSPELHWNCERDAQRDPYTEWANMWWWGNGITYLFETTSNPRLLLDDRDSGAVILMGPDGQPLHTTHKQYGKTCGPTSLNMVMEHLGFADRTQRLYMPRHLDDPAIPEYSALTGCEDVGYYLSMEHIMYEGYDRARSRERDWQENEFLDVGGYLKRVPTGNTRGHYEIDYELEYDANDKVQWWLEHGRAVGTKGGEVEVRVSRGLSFVANKFSEGQPDANPVDLSIGPGGNFASLDHLKEVIRGFIDNNIPLVIGVEDGGHFNTLMGYWDVGPYFYVYTADPLDGWGRPFYKKPMRWRRMLLTPEALPGGAKCIVSMMLYGHAGSAWAHDIDARFDPDILTGYLSSMPNFYPFFIEERPGRRPLEVPEGTTLTFPEDPTYGGIHRARDPEGAPITYHWDWDGDGSYDVTDSETSHYLTWRDGYLSRRVLVKACDGASSNSLCARAVGIWIVVTNVPPSPEVVDVEGSVEPFRSGYKYTLLIDDHDPAGWWDRPYTIDIDWGDGRSSSYVDESQADHFYAVSEHEQSRTIDISVTDKDGGQGSTSVTVTVPSQEDVGREREGELRRFMDRRIADLLDSAKEIRRLREAPEGFDIPSDIRPYESLVYGSLFKVGIADAVVDITSERALVRYNLPEKMNKGDVALYVMQAAATTGVQSSRVVIQTYHNFEPVQEMMVSMNDVLAFMNEEITYEEFEKKIEITWPK